MDSEPWSKRSSGFQGGAGAVLAIRISHISLGGEIVIFNRSDEGPSARDRGEVLILPNWIEGPQELGSFCNLVDPIVFLQTTTVPPRAVITGSVRATRSFAYWRPKARYSIFSSWSRTQIYQLAP